MQIDLNNNILQIDGHLKLLTQNHKHRSAQQQLEPSLLVLMSSFPMTVPSTCVSHSLCWPPASVPFGIQRFSQPCGLPAPGFIPNFWASSVWATNNNDDEKDNDTGLSSAYYMPATVLGSQNLLFNFQNPPNLQTRHYATERLSNLPKIHS